MRKNDAQQDMDKNITELCELGYKYGTDKCPQIKHGYTPVYYNLFKDKKNSVKKVVEMGIGHYKNMEKSPTIYDPGLKRTYHKGASLKMWRDFFPNAKVIGLDCVSEAMFSDDRIETYICDERNPDDIAKIIGNIGSDIDIFIDDGSHKLPDQVFLAKTILPLLSPNVIYIIEDIRATRQLKDSLSEYECTILDLPRTNKDEGLILVKNKI